MFIGIACNSCWIKEKTDWYLNTFKMNPERTTYANILCNANWRLFMSYLIQKKTSLYYIGPGPNSTQDLNVVERFHVDECLLDKWDSVKMDFMKSLEDWISIRANGEPKIFTFSAGPLTKVFLPYLAQKYPNHFYLDVGSAFDYFLKGATNRGYVNPADRLSRLVCDFEHGHKEIQY